MSTKDKKIIEMSNTEGKDEEKIFLHSLYRLFCDTITIYKKILTMFINIGKVKDFFSSRKIHSLVFKSQLDPFCDIKILLL